MSVFIIQVFCQQQNQWNTLAFGFMSLTPKSHLSIYWLPPPAAPHGTGKHLAAAPLDLLHDDWKAHGDQRTGCCWTELTKTESSLPFPHCWATLVQLFSPAYSFHENWAKVLIFVHSSFKNSWSWIMESKLLKVTRTVRHTAGTERISAKILPNLFDGNISNTNK